MRDVASMVRGEAVALYRGDVPVAHGEFESFEGHNITVTVNGGTMRVHPGSWVTVLDSGGRELGFAESEPDLRGDPPLLE